MLSPGSHIRPLFGHYSEPPLRDLRDAMVWPFLSHEKRRIDPMLFEHKGVKYEVIGSKKYGLATIWDWDAMIGIISQINEALVLGQDPSKVLAFSPSILLKSIGKGTSGNEYRWLSNSIRRLCTTTVIKRFKGENGRWEEEAYSWLNGYHMEGDDTLPSIHQGYWVVELPSNTFEAVQSQKGILAVHPHYLQLSSGIAKGLYRIARKSVPTRLGLYNWRIETLRHRLGIRRPINKFAYDLRKIASRDALPEYNLTVLKKREHLSVTFFRDRSKSPRPRRGVYHPDSCLLNGAK